MTVFENKISQYFRRAFGEDLILDRLGGNKIPLRVGGRRHPAQGEDHVSKTYIERLRDSTKLLQEQGDGMRSFASVILYLLAPGRTPWQFYYLTSRKHFFTRLKPVFLARLSQKKNRLVLNSSWQTHSPDVLHLDWSMLLPTTSGYCGYSVMETSIISKNWTRDMLEKSAPIH